MTDLTQQDSKQYGRPDNLKIIPFMKIAKPAAILLDFDYHCEYFLYSH